MREDMNGTAVAVLGGALFGVTFTSLGPDVNAMTPGVLVLLLVWAVVCSVVSVSVVWVCTVLRRRRRGLTDRPGRPSKNPES